jgi:hypothetical protein
MLSSANCFCCRSSPPPTGPKLAEGWTGQAGDSRKIDKALENRNTNSNAKEGCRRDGECGTKMTYAAQNDTTGYYGDCQSRKTRGAASTGSAHVRIASWLSILSIIYGIFHSIFNDRWQHSTSLYAGGKTNFTPSTPDLQRKPAATDYGPNNGYTATKIPPSRYLHPAEESFISWTRMTRIGTKITRLLRSRACLQYFAELGIFQRGRGLQFS